MDEKPNHKSKILIFSLILIIFLALGRSEIKAAKKFVRKTTNVRRSSSSSIPSVVRYRGDRLGINLSFLNFSGIDSVSYSFTYDTNGITQGAGGTITSANNPTAVRELLFGTCSGGVCRYHYNLSNARLVLIAKRTNGTTSSKIFRIKTNQ